MKNIYNKERILRRMCGVNGKDKIKNNIMWEKIGVAPNNKKNERRWVKMVHIWTDTTQKSTLRKVKSI